MSNIPTIFFADTVHTLRRLVGANLTEEQQEALNDFEPNPHEHFFVFHDTIYSVINDCNPIDCWSRLHVRVDSLDGYPKYHFQYEGKDFVFNYAGNGVYFELQIVQFWEEAIKGIATLDELKAMKTGENSDLDDELDYAFEVIRVINRDTPDIINGVIQHLHPDDVADAIPDAIVTTLPVYDDIRRLFETIRTVGDTYTGYAALDTFFSDTIGRNL